MPVTINVSAATVAVRAASDPDNIEPPIEAAMSVMFPAAVEVVEAYAPGAPDSVLNAAAVRVLGWLWESEAAETGAQPLIASGAAPLLAAWRMHRAGAVGAATDTPAPQPIPGGNVPAPPGIGHYILTSENGVLAWVLFPAP